MSDIDLVKKNSALRYIISFLRNEIVLVISFTAAVFSMYFVPPSASYLDYIDWKVLACLFCLMVVVAGLRKTGIFNIAAALLSRHASSVRGMAAILIMITFFASMAITNDVALITFVPFALLLMHGVSDPRVRISVITLQTIAANIGSSLTPFGNPQNLYLFTFYRMTPTVFFCNIAPVILAGGILLFAALLTIPKTRYAASHGGANHDIHIYKILLFVLLFALSVLAVFQAIDYRIVSAIVIILVLFFDRNLFAKIDYSLLFTFVGFFVFIGNLQHISSINAFLTSALEKNVVLVSALASQAISNVPAAILLSRFTTDSGSVLRGVSIGGMGTIIASLASVISFKFFVRERQGESMTYLRIFTFWNILFLICLYAICKICYG